MPFYPDEEFKVQENSFLNFIIGAFCSIISILAFSSIGNNFSSYLITITFLGISIIYIINGLKKKIILVVDKNGIYYYNKLITNWQNFNNAYYREESVTGNETNYFKTYLHVKYFSGLKEKMLFVKLNLLAHKINQKRK